MVEKWMDRLDLPDEPGPVQPLVEIVGCSRVLIEHHFGVTVYGQQQICVKVRFGSICVSGDRLTLRRISRGQLIVCGCIDAIKLERKCIR